MAGYLNEERGKPDECHESEAQPDRPGRRVTRPGDEGDRGEGLHEHQGADDASRASDVPGVIREVLGPTDAPEKRVVNELDEPDQAGQGEGGRRLEQEERGHGDGPSDQPGGRVVGGAGRGSEGGAGRMPGGLAVPDAPGETGLSPVHPAAGQGRGTRTGMGTG